MSLAEAERRRKLVKIAAQIESADTLFVDWDGCVFRNQQFIPGADRFLRRDSRKICVVSNNSTDLPSQFASALASANIEIPKSRIFLAGHVAIDHVASCFRKQRVYLLGSKAMRRYAREKGVALVKDDPDLVLLLRDPEFSYGKLKASVNFVREGAALVVANPDVSHPGDNGIVPETGALLAAITSCLDGHAPSPTVIGKPSPLLFELALNRVGTHPERALVIGDNPKTDIEGAARLGMPSVLVDPLQGVTLSDIHDTNSIHAGDGGRPHRQLDPRDDLS